MMPNVEITPRTRMARCAHKACYDKEQIWQVLDSIPECTIAICDPQTQYPRQMVTTHWRVGDALYIHGGIGSAFYKALVSGIPASVSVAATDGVVLARSAFETSIHFRSVMIYGRFEAVTDPGEQRALFEAFYEHLLPGRWREIRQPSDKELAATYILRLPLTEIVAKISQGEPEDKAEDLQIPSWGGVRVYQHGWGEFQPDSLSLELPLPDSVTRAG
jgi:hypothetical protein